MGNLGGWEIIIILGVLVLLFGAKKLPDMARSVGQSARVFKGEMKGLRDDKPAEEKAAQDRAQETAQPAPLPPAQPVTQPVVAEKPASETHPTQGTAQ